VTNWLHRNILDPLLALLRQGISPDRLALSVAIGVVVGNIPILGVSTILCAVIALAFRLDLAAIQGVQAAMAPTQLLLIIPFVRLGEWILVALLAVLLFHKLLRPVFERAAGQIK
jgi:uncharacterized protein (DUF2062 family)